MANVTPIFIMKTKHGIYYDLEESDYIVYTREIEYYFSSVSHKQKFYFRLDENREKVRRVLSNRYGLTVAIDQIADIELYSKIESRGFYIIAEGNVFTCKKSIILSGVNKILKNYEVRYSDLIQKEQD